VPRRSNAEVIEEIKRRAANGPDGIYVTDSAFEHSIDTVSAMSQVGGKLQNSQKMTLRGKQHLVERYVLPDGTTILAGYEL
jgi:hypothetical protein